MFRFPIHIIRNSNFRKKDLRLSWINVPDTEFWLDFFFIDFDRPVRKKGVVVTYDL